MAINRLSKFGDESTTTYSIGAGLRYTDSYWGGETGPSARRTGFIPNTPISPIQMNTLLSQTTMCSYILGQVLANSILMDKKGDALITKTNITSECTQDDANTNYASKLINFLNRINQISGNGGTGTESVWRSRQIGYGDSGDFWKVVNISKPSTQCALSPSSTSCELWVNSISRFTGSAGSDPTLTFNADNIESSHKIVATSADINGVLNADTLNVSETTTLTGTLNANGRVNIKSVTTITGSPLLVQSESINLGNETTDKVNIYTQYNSAGNTSGSGSRQQVLQEVLNNIGTRLDNLGFSKGSVTPASTASASVNWLRKQGNYVVGHFTASRQGVGSGWANGQTLFTIPNGFRPYESYTIVVGVGALTGSGIAYGYSTLTFNTDGAVVWSHILWGDGSSAVAATSVDIQFGHSITAWQE